MKRGRKPKPRAAPPAEYYDDGARFHLIADLPRDPVTPAEWQEAVDGAEFFLGIDSARQYGLITGGPVVNCERAAELLERGRALGYWPAPLDELTRRFIDALNEPAER